MDIPIAECMHCETTVAWLGTAHCLDSPADMWHPHGLCGWRHAAGDGTFWCYPDKRTGAYPRATRICRKVESPYGCDGPHEHAGSCHVSYIGVFQDAPYQPLNIEHGVWYQAPSFGSKTEWLEAWTRKEAP